MILLYTFYFFYSQTTIFCSLLNRQTIAQHRFNNILLCFCPTLGTTLRKSLRKSLSTTLRKSLSTTLCKSFFACIAKHIILYHHSVEVLIISIALGIGHRVILKFFACLLQSGSSGVFLYYSTLQVSNPLLQRSHRYLVELVDTHKNVLGEYLCRTLLH